jgi:hypothetical protein
MDPLGVDSRPVYTVATDLDAPGWSWQRRVIVDAYGAGLALFCAARRQQQGDSQRNRQQASTTAH